MYNPLDVENEILKYWKENKIPERVEEARRHGKGFSFLEGPPTVNGPPHVGHFRGRAMKDVVLRFKTMQGFNVRKQAGWDCQGLPMEVEVEKELKIKNKKEIDDKIGTKNFIDMCRKRVDKYIENWTNLSKRLGMWMDWDNAYKTMNPEYI